MYKGYEYRLYPTKQQVEMLNKTFGCCRFVYNKALDIRLRYYQQTQKDIKSFELSKMLTEWKKELTWLKEVDSQSLQQELRHLDNAYTKFYREKKGFPKFKSKHNNRKSYTTTSQCIKLLSEENRIFLTKIGKVKIRLDRLPKGIILSGCVKKTPTNKYFISLTVKENIIIPNKSLVKEETSIGIDLGIKDFCILSDGRKIANPKFLRNKLQRLKVLQKRASRKQKGGQNRKKANLKVALLHEQISNKRKDFLHKLTYQLCHENQVDTICLETLKVQNMMKNHKLARCIQEVSWSSFNSLLDYKTELYGKNILRIGTFEPSTKLCSCGFKNNKLTLADREWTCPKCGTHHDRDILAANNIKRFALNKQNLIKTGLTKPEEPLELPTKVGMMN